MTRITKKMNFLLYILTTCENTARSFNLSVTTFWIQKSFEFAESAISEFKIILKSSKHTIPNHQSNITPFSASSWSVSTKPQRELTHPTALIDSRPVSLSYHQLRYPEQSQFKGFRNWIRYTFQYINTQRRCKVLLSGVLATFLGS